MSATQQPEQYQEQISEKSIAHYLKRHPEFFIRHTDILTEIKLPHQINGAISLIEHQIDVLRTKTREQQHQLHALIQVARDNDRINERLQRLTLMLLENQSLDDVLHILHHSLHQDFRAENIALRLFYNPKILPQEQNMQLINVSCMSRDRDNTEEAFGVILKSGKPVCGRLRRIQLQYLFGEDSEHIASAVGLPLIYHHGDPDPQPMLGILGIGSSDPHRFHVGMGTLFLAHMGKLIGHALKPHLCLA